MFSHKNQSNKKYKKETDGQDSSGAQKENKAGRVLGSFRRNISV